MRNFVSKRIIWADSLKGVLMLVVIFSHALQTTIGAECENSHLFNIICSFQMPAFVAVSGYLAYRTGKTNLYKDINSCYTVISRRFKQLIIPFLLWDFLKICFADELTYKRVVELVLCPDTGYWFLWVLFFIFFIFVLSNWMSYAIKVKEEMIMAGMCLTLTSIMVLLNVRIFGFQFIAYYFLFYIVGYYLYRYESMLVTKNYFYIIILTILWFILAWFWKMHELPLFLKRFPLPEALLQYSYRFVTALTALYVLLALSPLVLNSKKKWNEPLVQIGIVSLGLYTSHLIVMKWIVSVYKELNMSYSLVTVISFATALAFSWIIVWILGKWNITSKLLLGKI